MGNHQWTDNDQIKTEELKSKSMWGGVMNYLKDPQLVAAIQEFFGVDIHDAKLLQTCRKRKSLDKNSPGPQVIDENGCLNEDKCIERIDCQSQDFYPKSHDSLPQTTSPKINNHFWYYLFLFSTELGGEIFYSAFIPLWCWNIDAAVGRRTILVWAITLTTGQILKDVIRWNRPSYPAIRLQNKWSKEYGMPSTHATVGISIPLSVLLFSMDKYSYSVPLGLTIVVIWCSLICLSRLYLGMHTVLDIIAGLALAIVLMIPLVPLVDILSYYLITNGLVLSILIAISVATIVYYPCSDKWTPTRSDTTMVVAVTVGMYAGTWLNFKSGLMKPRLMDKIVYNVAWPSHQTLQSTILRTLLGVLCILPLKMIFKKLTYNIICAILKINPKELVKSEDSLDNKYKTLVDLIYRFIYCFLFGVNAFYVIPWLFTNVALDRPEFYSEM